MMPESIPEPWKHLLLGSITSRSFCICFSSIEAYDLLQESRIYV